MGFLSDLGNRKLVITLVLMITGVVVAIVKGDIPEHLQLFLEVLFGGFVVGNGIEHITNTQKVKYSSSSSTPVSAPTPVTVDTSHIEASQKQIAEGVSLIQELLKFIITKTGLDKAPPK